MSRARLFFLGALLLVAVVSTLGGAWYFERPKLREHSAHEAPSKASGRLATAAPASAVATSLNSIAATSASHATSPSLAPGLSPGDLQFIPREKIAAIKFTDKNGDSDTDTSYEFYRVGRFVRGPNQGADLLQAWVSQIAWPCKGDCGEPAAVRYIEKDKVVFPLPKISDPRAPAETVGRGTAVDPRPFDSFGATAGPASDFRMPILDYPQTIAVSPRAVVRRASEGVGALDPAALQLAFHDPVYGDVWMTKPGLGPQKVFYEECKDVNPNAEASEARCEGLPAFTDNAFYFFRPDGTYLSYVYTSDFHPEDPGSVTWNDGPLPAGTSYANQSLVGCSWGSADSISVVSPASVGEADMEPIGKVNATGDPLYGLKDKNHPLYKEFYAAYASSFPAWASEMQNDHTAKEVPYDDFVRARPLFLWKDPFSRLIRFVNTRFIMPNACEPVVYLYPPEKRNIHVTLGSNVTVFNSYPTYQHGWTVAAQPGGELTDLSGGRRSPYLFWEGHSYILPEARGGYVVSSGDVPTFLAAILPKLGLNQKEASDFMDAWSPKLTAAPFYFITFLDKSVIDRYFPVQIEPPPNTTIRVFMDFAPLSEPITVQPPILSRPPQRQGFTVVEWGVLVR